MRIVTVLAPVLLVCASSAVAEEGCLAKDKTGMAWVHPFEAAEAQAQSETRLLMIKPVAFGTSDDGGW